MSPEGIDPQEAIYADSYKPRKRRPTEDTPTPPCDRNYNDGGAHTVKEISGVAYCIYCKRPVSEHSKQDDKQLFTCDSCGLPNSATYGDGKLWGLCGNCYTLHGTVVSKLAFRSNAAQLQLVSELEGEVNKLEVDIEATEKHIESTGLTGDELEQRVLDMQIEADDRLDVLSDVTALLEHKKQELEGKI